MHDPACALLRECARATGLVVAPKEPRGLPGAGRGGGDLLMRGGGSEFPDAVVDLTFPSVVCASVLPEAADTKLVAALTAEKSKCEKHGPATAANNLGFVPFVVEATGAWGGQAQKLLAKLAERVADEAPAGTTWAAPTFTQYWLQRMAVHMQRSRMQAVRAIAAKARTAHERTWMAG